MIIKATIDDYAEIYSLYRLGVQKMIEEGLDQWDDEYPGKNEILTDIKSNTLFKMMVKNTIVGVITLNEEQQPEYKDIEWEINDSPVLVVHRLCILPTSQKSGYAKQIMQNAENYAFSEGYKSIRLDTNSSSKKANGLYSKIGYTYKGKVYFTNREFNCYEKKYAEFKIC